MNRCFLAGWIEDIYKFKFIYNKNIKHKCIANFKLKLLDKQEIEVIAFDELIETVIINKFKFVYIYAKFARNMNIELIEMYTEEEEIL